MTPTLSSPNAKPETLDDVMLAMDVVDTLRHERGMAEIDLNAEGRREDLVTRLRAIYDAQGISVPDDILMDGVLALEEERFAYSPPKAGFKTSLARLYIRRRKWLPLVYTLAFIIGSVLAVNYAGFVRPAQIKAKQSQTLIAEVLPQRLESAYERAHSLASTKALKAQAEDMKAQAALELGRQDAQAAQESIGRLEDFSAQLSQSYQLRVVSRFNEASGIYLDSKVNSDIRNFYLITEAVTAQGEVLELPIEDEEYKTVKRVSKFGVRVPKAVFDAVAADKKDDQIIQNDIIGAKARGVIAPSLSFDGSENWPLGYIVEW